MRSRAPGLAWLLAALCALALAAVVGLGWASHKDAAAADAEQADRASVIEAARQFVVTWNTFKATDAEGYVKSVEPLLTTKFRADFTAQSPDVITGITQQQLSSTGTVLSDGLGTDALDDDIPLIAVSSLDRDSAQVLVVSDANRVSGGQTVVRHWRWQVSLSKVGNDWLVDSFKEA